MANIAGKRLLSGTAISPAARNRTRLLAIPGRLSQCLRRAVRFWLTAAPARCRLTSVGDLVGDDMCRPTRPFGVREDLSVDPGGRGPRGTTWRPSRRVLN